MTSRCCPKTLLPAAFSYLVLEGISACILGWAALLAFGFGVLTLPLGVGILFIWVSLHLSRLGVRNAIWLHRGYGIDVGRLELHPNPDRRFIGMFFSKSSWKALAYTVLVRPLVRCVIIDFVCGGLLFVLFQGLVMGYGFEALAAGDRMCPFGAAAVVVVLTFLISLIGMCLLVVLSRSMRLMAFVTRAFRFDDSTFARRGLATCEMDLQSGYVSVGGDEAVECPMASVTKPLLQDPKEDVPVLERCEKVRRAAALGAFLLIVVPLVAAVLLSAQTASAALACTLRSEPKVIASRTAVALNGTLPAEAMSLGAVVRNIAALGGLPVQIVSKLSSIPGYDATSRVAQPTVGVWVVAKAVGGIDLGGLPDDGASAFPIRSSPFTAVMPLLPNGRMRCQAGAVYVYISDSELALSAETRRKMILDVQVTIPASQAEGTVVISPRATPVAGQVNVATYGADFDAQSLAVPAGHSVNVRTWEGDVEIEQAVVNGTLVVRADRGDVEIESLDRGVNASVNVTASGEVEIAGTDYVDGFVVPAAAGVKAAAATRRAHAASAGQAVAVRARVGEAMGALMAYGQEASRLATQLATWLVGSDVE